MKTTQLGRTLCSQPQTEQRLAALSIRRQQNSFLRFLESLDGQGFEFHHQNASAHSVN